MAYLGSFTPGSTVYYMFNTKTVAQVPIALAGSPVVEAYKNASTTQDNSGFTLTVDFDGVVGLNHVACDTSTDGTFYATASEVFAYLSAGTVNSVSVVGEVLFQFSLLAAANIDANVEAVNGVAVQGAGTSGDKWRPV